MGVHQRPIGMARAHEVGAEVDAIPVAVNHAKGEDVGHFQPGQQRPQTVLDFGVHAVGGTAVLEHGRAVHFVVAAMVARRVKYGGQAVPLSLNFLLPVRWLLVSHGCSSF